MIKEYRLNSWSDFKSLVSERLSYDQVFRRGKFLFRGQEDSEWKLVSSFDREFKRIEYKELLENFKHEYRNILEIKNTLIKSNNKTQKFTALGQHYGLPTRLLDWTESPYFAAFFAYQAALRKLSGESLSSIRAENKSVAIWALDSEGFWNEHIMRPSQEENKRLYNQLGCFTKLPKMPSGGHYTALDDFVEDYCKKDKTVILWKFIIPLRDVLEVMADLSLMRIDATSLMGGDEGRAQAALNNTILDSIQQNK